MAWLFGEYMGSSASTDFLPTRWTVVVAAAARQASEERAREALAELAQAYWYPLYSYIRRRGYDAAAAEDLTQGFFAQLIEKHFLESVDRGKGRFRAFLLACVNHFLANERDRAHAQKRGGTRKFVSLDEGESRYATDCRAQAAGADTMTPERLFERRWALAVLERVLGRLQTEYAETGHQTLFAALKETLTGGASGGHAEKAAKLGMTAGAVKVAAHRLRRRYRDILRDEIAQTVATPEDVAGEIAYLMKCL
jgi:DNA-directed RNA polymerase specialized sigma24 family protein